MLPSISILVLHCRLARSGRYSMYHYYFAGLEENGGDPGLYWTNHYFHYPIYWWNLPHSTLGTNCGRYVHCPQESSLRMGTIFYGLACVMMVAAFFCNYVMIGKQAVPTLYLANTISPLLGLSLIHI